MQVHHLKTINPYFTAVWIGVKTFEVRNNDRHFQVGDHVYLKEYNPTNNSYSGRVIYAIITYVLHDYEPLNPSFIVFSFKTYHSYQPRNFKQ